MARTGFQLVDLSPWPLRGAFRGLGIATGFLFLFSEGIRGLTLFVWISTIFLLVGTCSCWWGDVVLESTFLGDYTKYVIRNLKWGFGFFLLSEVFFFVGFFWAFINSCVGELSIHHIAFWPPIGIKPLIPWKIPLLNTFVLIGSGVTVTWAHKAVKIHNKLSYDDRRWDWVLDEGVFALGWTIFLGVCFTALQVYEYYWASFSIRDGIYGSTFFLLTGFHGMHVIAGTIFLVVCLFRLRYLHFRYKHFHFGLDAAVLYWHFVDVVWIVVFALIYVYGYWGYE